jgi:hypothetical protein
MTATITAVKRRSDDGVQAAAAGPLSAEELRKMHAYWRAANYLSVGQIYLYDNPLLKQTLTKEHVFVARWIGLPPGGGEHFLLNTGTLCVLSYYRKIPAVRIWNGPLLD